MAIDEQDTFAAVADHPDDEHQVAPDLRHTPGHGTDLPPRLGSSVFAREGGLSTSNVPGVRELTWEHVTNPTTSHPVVVPGSSIFGEEGGNRPAPLKLDEVLARRDIALKPIEPLAPVFGGTAEVTGLPGVATSAPAPLAPPAPDAAPAAARPFDTPPAGMAAAAAPPAAATDATPSAPARPALPSFADLISSDRDGGTGSVPSYAAGDLGVDSLVKPIEEKPPVARETDPLVSGLAELIVKATPSAGMPRVADLREVSRTDTGMVPATPAAPLDPPVLDAAVEFAHVPSAQVPVIEPEEPRAATGVHAVATPADAVEAELNRLAYVPDHDEPVGPVEVPSIEYSDGLPSGPVSTSLPAQLTLSQGELYQPRPSSAPVRHAGYNDILGSTLVPVVTRRRKRNIFGKFVTMLVLLGMVGGGLFAVKHFVLDKVRWDSDVEPLAMAVQNERGLTFEESVSVTELPSAEYAGRLVAAAGFTEERRAIDAIEQRAFGLATGDFDAATIGLAATVDTPAFYDPSDHTIYVVAGLDATFREFALHRALTMALLDQHFGWSSMIDGAATSVATGTRTLFDADALAVAQALLPEGAGADITEAQVAMLASLGVKPSPSPYATAVAGRLGVALWPYFSNLTPDTRNFVETDAAVTDGRVLDLRRLTSSDPDSAVALTSKGMLFWYHALAGRVDPELAWRAALAWKSDTVVEPEVGGEACVTAEVRFADSAATEVAAAFFGFLSGAPEASKTTVEIAKADATTQTIAVSISACDPGASVPANDGRARLSLGGAPLRAAQYAVVVAPLTGADADELAACAVYGTDAVTTEDERPLVDGPDGWPRVAAHGTPDPTAAGCTAG